MLRPCRGIVGCYMEVKWSTKISSAEKYQQQINSVEGVWIASAHFPRNPMDMFKVRRVKVSSRQFFKQTFLYLYDRSEIFRFQRTQKSITIQPARVIIVVILPLELMAYYGAHCNSTYTNLLYVWLKGTAMNPKYIRYTLLSLLYLQKNNSNLSKMRERN